MSYHKVGECLGLIIHSPKPVSPKALPAISDLADCSLVSDSFLERFETQRLSDSSPEITPPPAVGSLLPKSDPEESASCCASTSSSLNVLQPSFPEIPPFSSLSSASDSEVNLNLSSTRSSSSSVCQAAKQVGEVRSHPAHKRRRQRSFSTYSQNSVPSTKPTSSMDSSDEEMAPLLQSASHQECKRLKKTPLYYSNHRKGADKLNSTQPHPWPHNHPLRLSDCHKKNSLYQCYQSVVKTRHAAAHQVNDENLAPSSLKFPSSPHQRSKRVKKTPLHPLYRQAENTLGAGLHLRAKDASSPDKDC